MLFNGRPFAVTCERTFDDGRPVIGNGVYKCRRSVFHRGGYPTFEIIVPGHTRVLFHRGNVETESEACVLVAEAFSLLNGVTAVTDSRGGFREFMELAGNAAAFDLIVSGR